MKLQKKRKPVGALITKEGESLRSRDERLALGSLDSKELQFVVEMAHLLRDLQREGCGITINNYAVNTDKFIIVMEQNITPKTTEGL